MNKDQDKFSQLIKDKLEDFEVPFNEGHWNEFSDKLDAAPSNPSGKSGLSKALIGITAASVVLISSYFILKPEDEIKEEVVVEESVEPSAKVQTEISQEELTTTDKTVSETKEVLSPVMEDDEVTEPAEVTDNDTDVLENKIDRYNEMSEDQIRETSKQLVEEMVADEELNKEKTPNIDNSALRTNITVQSGAICAMDKIQFGLDRKIDGAKYYWNFGDNGLTSRKAEPTHTFKKAGNYTVTLLVSKGEKNDYKAEYDVVVTDKPSLEVIVENDIITLNNPYLELSAETGENVNVTWTFNDQMMSGINALFLIRDKGFYNVVAKATSKNGCMTESQESFNIDKGWKMTVEGTFTPNGDGKNDVFAIKEIQQSNVSFDFSISDSRGQEVFRTNDRYSEWNGTVNNNGAELPDGPYFWKVSFEDDRGKVHTQEGRISILR